MSDQAIPPILDEIGKRRQNLRAMTRSAYDLQKLRIQAGLRLCANFRAKLGQVAGETEDDLEENAKKVIDVLRASFVRLTDGIAKNRTLPAREGFHGDELITDYTELVLIAQYVELERVEKQQFRQLEGVLVSFPIYTTFLTKVRGVGPAMAAVIISEFDIHRARYVSSLWAYAGLDVGPDGRGRSRRAEHLVKRKYIDKDGVEQERNSITFNPFLKTKLMGVLAGSFLRTASPYADVYRNYKHRLETDPAKADWSKGRRNEAAKRYAVKMFLADLYGPWRTLEGLPVAPRYSEGKLGMVHSRAPTDHGGEMPMAEAAE
jgi:hypothetical protein